MRNEYSYLLREVEKVFYFLRILEQDWQVRLVDKLAENNPKQKGITVKVQFIDYLTLREEFYEDELIMPFNHVLYFFLIEGVEILSAQDVEEIYGLDLNDYPVSAQAV